jgi:protoporphyrin/coproporphyrin ferrochelatase
MTVQPEPAHAHGSAPSTAIVLCNLGTPDAPTPAAVRRYLAEFLSDPRVVEIPRAAWLPILHGVVLRVRPARSARKYASIWTPEGSPLRVWSEKQAQLLAGYLGQRGHRVAVRCAMRYGTPSIASVLDAAKADGAERILVLPLYPQYAASTTASIADALAAWTQRIRNLPEIRFVKHYHDDAGYIDALGARVEEHWRINGRPDKLVLSFHGLPRRSLALGDPYHCECLKTGRLLAERLKLRDDAVAITFQSRFGRAEWLQPYTEPTLVALAKAGVGRVDVFCPGFTCDCLETLEEIDQAARAAFLTAGGREFGYVPCLNDQHEWIAALAAVAIRHLQGWDTGLPDGAAAEALDAQRRRALAAGAAA